ncbi:metabolite traffic protein EboE [Paraburkholderia sp. D15]|uniref:metabolite traffic protein EboE n=1 Tax=Paraburkholderia sp. D15 TaxID=2880218 RepID=UPI002479356B|nr:metabolite traffic protein EboE [Paraburkholderia sp. D15]WGS53299.1 metabolite traffic protein EboE [Paraburkholderia sp. D15]
MNDANPLTYCTNIHPGDTWADVRRNLEGHALQVKRACSPTQSFPLGLRISAQAAFELDDAEIRRFSAWCDEHDCHVLTLNGFPYGSFHDTSVKETVYLPDWRDPRRVAYTNRLADLLAHWTPRDRVSSISTVPIACRDGFAPEHWPTVKNHLLHTLTHLARLHERGGPLIRLALEPEPYCVLEQTAETIAFFERMNFPASLADYIGVCFDCCHQAVEFEAPADCLDQLTRAGIRVAKVQVSSALRARGDAIAHLLQFDEPTYLHQAVLRRQNGALERFSDLPGLARWLERGETADECRVHFHVPIFLAELGAVGTTRFFLEDFLPRVAPGTPLEVETYSFGVLPSALRLDSIGDSIARELNWVKETLLTSRGETLLTSRGGTLVKRQPGESVPHPFEETLDAAHGRH